MASIKDSILAAVLFTAGCATSISSPHTTAREAELRGDFKKASTLYKKLGLFGNAGAASEKAEDLEAALDIYEISENEDGFERVKQKIIIQSVTYFKHDDLLKASRLYEKIREINRAAETAAAAGDFERASKLYEKGEYYINAAETAEKAGNPERAFELYYKIERWESAAQIFCTTEDGRLKEKFKKMLSGNSKLISYASACERNGEIQDAAELYDLANCNVAAGELWELLDNKIRAVQSYEQEKSELLKEKISGLSFSIAKDAEEKEDYPLALEYYIKADFNEKASSIAPKTVSILAEQGEFKKAIEFAKQFEMKEQYEKMVKLVDK